MISIIIPTLNEESVLQKTLEFLKRKMTLPHEVIISDGRSTDRTIEIGKTYANKVVIYSGTKRQTIGQARNEGSAEAVGDFLVFMDADCSVQDPDAFFRRALHDFEKDTKLVALTGWLAVLPEFATTADKIIFGLQNVYNTIMNDWFNFGISPGGEFQMIPTAVFRRIGGYNQNLVASEDLELFKRLSNIGNVRLDTGLKIFHTGRRAHKIGWPKLLSLWFLNTMSMTFRGKAYVDEWKVIR